MHLRIHHQTDYHYAAGVSAAQHIAHLQPPDTPWQRCTAHRLDIGRLALTQGRLGAVNQVVHLAAEHQAHGLVEPATRLVYQVWVGSSRLLAKARKQRYLLYLPKLYQARTHAIVNVVRVVRNLIGQVA